MDLHLHSDQVRVTGRSGRRSRGGRAGDLCGSFVFCVLAGGALCVWAGSGGTAAHAQDPAPKPILSIEFSGLTTTQPTFVADIVRIRAGDVYDPAAVEAATQRLLRTGRFLAASHSVVDAGEGVRITFEVHERRVLTAIRFEGYSEFREGRLLDQVELKVGQAIDWFAVRDGQEAVLALYRDEGFKDVTVSVDREHAEATGELIFRINEGERTRIREIEIEGNTAFSDRELKRQIESKTALWFIRSGALDADRLEGDVAQLQRFYRDAGYLDAVVSARQEPVGDGQDLCLVFTVEEGTRYVIESIQVTGATVFPVEELLSGMTSQVGGIILQPVLDADVRMLRDKYGELGYIYVAVRAVRVFSESPGQVRITVEIEEGEQFRVGRVVVRGNARTKDKVARRALNLYPPDDLFNVVEAREAERRLVETRVFGSARVIPVGDQPGVRDAVIDVTESEKAGDLLFALGVTSNSGLVGSVVLDIQNFDLFDWPRNWAELYKFRAFHGAGQRMRIELQPGSEVTRFRVDFTEPYLFDKPLRFDASLYYFERERDGYDETRYGTSVSLGKRFERGYWRGWSGEVALQLENVTIDNLELFTARDIRDDEGDHFLSSLKGSLVRDRTDSRFLPTTGDRLRISYEQFLGEYSFGKLTAGYSWFTTVHTDALERKSVLQLRGEGGAVAGDAPVFERFYAGGTGSIRGFDYRGVGERQGLDDNNIGGDYLLLLGAEYSYPLYGDNLRGHVFLDTGTAGSGAYRAAVGVGVRLTLDILGPLPLEFNIAAPVSSGDGDEEQVFSFVVGSLF